ncbi:unnamed protein product [Ranitomeya imitator]|uniref:Uncharacterized protein n=1 Tax=Ranitomeya imitator TaxID=111125 RepID=A0ABN9KQY9_9NEOB|nr:unnamed protein product [Ranitomeya imitator]
MLPATPVPIVAMHHWERELPQQHIAKAWAGSGGHQKKVEARVASDQDLKLSELLRYYMLNIEAAKDLLLRRTKSLVEYENSNKALDKARLKSKDVKQAELQQQQCCQKFEKLSESGKQGRDEWYSILHHHFLLQMQYFNSLTLLVIIIAHRTISPSNKCKNGKKKR